MQVTMNFYFVPIIESGAFNSFIINAETEFADQMQRRKGCRTEPRNVAGIRRNFRLKKDHVKHARLRA